MNNKYQIQKSASRAIEIYEYALTQGDQPFTAESIPDWKWDVSNKTSMKMLTDRGLVRLFATKPRRYKLGRRTGPVDCLNTSESADKASGITRFTVPVGILDRFAGEPGLIDHRIKA